MSSSPFKRRALAEGRAAEEEALPALPPEEARALLSQIGDRTGQTLDNLFYALDTPGAIARSLITGEGNPFGSWDERVTGREMLEGAGLLSDSGTTLGKTGNAAAGIAAEILLDPLAYLSGPAKALTAGGKVAAKAGLLDDAARVASNKVLAGTLAGDSTSRMTASALSRAGLPITQATTAARPLVGKRYAMRNTTLDELVQNVGADIADPAARQALQASKKAAVDVALAKKGLAYADVADQPLARTMGVGLPMGDAAASFDILGRRGGDALASAMDYLGQSAGWSYPGRVAGALFQKKTGGTTGVAEQVGQIRLNQLKNAEARAADSLNARLVVEAKHAEIPASIAATTGVTKLFSAEGNDALVRLLELPQTAWTAKDRALYSAPDVKKIVDQWGSLRKTMLDESQRWGIGSHELAHPYGIQYLPQQQTELTLLHGGKAPAGGFDYTHMTADQLKRSDAFKVPGGRETLRKLSLNPDIAGLSRQGSDQDAASLIKQIIANDHGVNFPDAQAVALARAMKNIPDEAVRSGASIFGQHPIEDIARYTLGRRRAIGAARTKVETLADHLVAGDATAIPGGGHVSVSEALRTLGLNSTTDPNTGLVVDGALERLREAIQSRRPGAAVDVANMSVPKNVVDRLNRAMDIYQSPELQSKFGKAFDSVTKVWKAGTLTWPSRYVRDLYSGVVSNALETGDLAGVVWSSGVARNILAGKTDAAAAAIAGLPKYKGLTPNEALKEFLVDAGSSRILSGTSTEDLLTANRTGDTAQELIPGFSPQTPTSILAEELLPKTGRKWGEFARDFVTVKGTGVSRQALETRNPLFRAGERMGDWSDGINRLTGYLTLLKQGVDPAEAAKRITAAQVDYGSLTTIERNLFTRILVPFWAYTSRMSAYVAKSLVERPGGRYGQLVRGVHDMMDAQEDGGYMPDYIREQVGYRVGETDDGSTFLTDIDLPGFDYPINMIKPGAGVFDAQRTLESVGQMMHPAIRTLAEHATGTNFYYKQPLGSPGTETGWDLLAQRVAGDRLPAAANSLMQFVPFAGRVGSVLRTALDEDRTPGQRGADTILNNLSGVKRRFVPKGTEMREAARKIEESLRGRVRQFSRVYVPENELANLSPGQQREYTLYKMLQSHAQKSANARRKGQPTPPAPF